MYKFTFDAYDEVSPRPGRRYGDLTENNVTVEVLAQAEEAALEKAKAVTTRTKYILERVEEVAEAGAPTPIALDPDQTVDTTPPSN